MLHVIENEVLADVDISDQSLKDLLKMLQRTSNVSAVIERRGQILRARILQCFVKPVQVSLEKLNVCNF